MTDLDNGSSGVTLEQAQQMMEGFSSVNLDEVSPETLTVTFREFYPTPDSEAGYYIETTQKQIRTFVPMFLFNRMQSNQKKVQRLRKKNLLAAEFAKQTTQEDENEESFDFLAERPLNFAEITHEAFKDILAASEPMLIWQATEVLAVWRLTPGEEDMSLKHLLLGLDFEKIEALFLRFFVEKIQRRRIRA
jgi:hypothetical protein